MKYASEDITKLPKWVQSKIEQLENSVEYWKVNAGIREGFDSPIRADIGVGKDCINIPDCPIKFKMSNGEISVIRDSDAKGKSFLKIYGSGTMSDTIHITPWAANCCRIEIE